MKDELRVLGDIPPLEYLSLVGSPVSASRKLLF